MHSALPVVLLEISSILTTVLAAALGIFTLFRNPRSPVNRLWFFTSLAVTVWSIGYLLLLWSDDSATASGYLTVVYTGATLIPVFFFHFATAFLLKPRPTLVVVGYLTAAVLLGLIFFTSTVISGVRYLPDFGYYEEVAFPLFAVYLLYFFGYTALTIVVLAQAFRRADGIKRVQTLALLLAAVVGLGGGATNFITALTGIYPYGHLVVFLYPILITYGIFLPTVRIKI